MKRIKIRRLLVALVFVSLVFCGLPAAALAGSLPDENSGLCQHHPQHTSQCGYAREKPCKHERHSSDCYTDELICDDTRATPSDASGDHTHTEECYRLDCPHRQGNHAPDLDDGCGYTEAEPCRNTCELCGGGGRQGWGMASIP